MKLPNFLEQKLRGLRIARRVADTLNTTADWEPGSAGTYGYRLTSGTWEVISTKCDSRCLGFLRLFDHVALRHDGVEVFLPLLGRIMVRNAGRVYIQRQAEKNL